MQTKDNASVARTASVMRSNKSAVSRNQSLIKKQTAPNDTHPSDILVERFQGWKAIVKQLIAYFEVSAASTRMVKSSGDADVRRYDALIGHCGHRRLDCKRVYKAGCRHPGALQDRKPVLG